MAQSRWHLRTGPVAITKEFVEALTGPNANGTIVLRGCEMLVALVFAVGPYVPPIVPTHPIDPPPSVAMPNPGACWTNDYVQKRYGPFAQPPGSTITIDPDQNRCDRAMHLDDATSA